LTFFFSYNLTIVRIIVLIITLVTDKVETNVTHYGLEIIDYFMFEIPFDLIITAAIV
jgi:hypothetical protein